MKRRKRMRERGRERFGFQFIESMTSSLTSRGEREKEGGIREMMMLMMISWRIGPLLLLRSARRRFRRAGRQSVVVVLLAIRPP